MLIKYSITERRVPELIPVLGVNHKPGGRLPLLSAFTLATLKMGATNFGAWCLVNRGTVGVNSLPKSVTRQRHRCDLNSGPSTPESSTLTTRLPYLIVVESKYYRLNSDCATQAVSPAMFHLHDKDIALNNFRAFHPKTEVKTNLWSDWQPMRQRNAGRDRERRTITGRSWMRIISQLIAGNRSLCA